MKLETDQPWEVFGALAERVQTVWGSLHTALRVEHRETLLIRGGKTPDGLTAAILAKLAGLWACNLAPREPA